MYAAGTRVVFFAVGGLLLTLLLFWTMQFVVTGSSYAEKVVPEYASVDFIRIKRELEPEVRSRAQEPPPEIPKLTIEQTLQPLPAATQVKPFPIAIRMPRYRLPVLMDGGLAIDASLFGMGDISRNLVPVHYIPPQYPYKARRKKIEGFVELEFTVTETGLVRDIVVKKSEPKGVFEDSAIKAVSRWRFNPKKIGGQAVSQRAAQVVRFSLREGA